MITDEQKTTLEDLFNIFDSAVKRSQEGVYDKAIEKLSSFMKKLSQNGLSKVTLAELEESSFLPRELSDLPKDTTLDIGSSYLLVKIYRALANLGEARDVYLQGINKLKELLPESSQSRTSLIKPMLDNILNYTNASNIDRHNQDASSLYEECKKETDAEQKLYFCITAIDAKLQGLSIIREKFSENFANNFANKSAEDIQSMARYVHDNVTPNYVTQSQNADVYAQLYKVVHRAFPQGHDDLGLYQYYVGKAHSQLGNTDLAKEEFDAAFFAIRSGSLEEKENLMAEIDRWQKERVAKSNQELGKVEQNPTESAEKAAEPAAKEAENSDSGLNANVEVVNTLPVDVSGGNSTVLEEGAN